jgi:YesN/AraC family two-component response regulator
MVVDYSVLAVTDAIVLTGIMMPIMDGPTMIRHMKRMSSQVN